RLQRHGGREPDHRLPRLGGSGLDVDRHALLRHEYHGHDLAEHVVAEHHGRQRDAGVSRGGDSVDPTGSPDSRRGMRCASLAFFFQPELPSTHSMTLRSTRDHVTSSLRRRAWLPGLLVVAVSIIPVAGVFTLSRIFFLRDLTITFRSRYLFLRHAVASGAFPLWDPYPANGQAAVNDALYQLFHLPTLLIRLVLPDPVAFNIWVAAPIPIAAFGMYLFLRRHLGQAASAFGAIAYAVSGPIVSTTNFPNLSWSVAAVPYVFSALDRLFSRRLRASGGLL